MHTLPGVHHVLVVLRVSTLAADISYVGDRSTTARDDRGFTLIELMVVVLIIAILLAIAIPTFLGARERAADRAAQSNLRNAHTSAFIYYVGSQQQFPTDPGQLQAIDPSLEYEAAFTDLDAEGAIFVYVPPAGTTRPLDTIFLAAESRSGRCFWIRSIGDENHPRFAEESCGVAPDTSDAELGYDFLDKWR